MSNKTPSSLVIVGRLTLILLIAVSFLAVYSSILMRFAGAGAEDHSAILSRILRGASEFRPVLDEGGKVIYYEAFDETGALMGYGFIVTGRGMWGDIRLAGGIDLNYRIIGLRVLEQGETPGLGARIVESRFLDQFKGLGSGEVKLKKFNGKVDAITGASISSRAVTDIIRAEVEKIAKIRGGHK